MAKHIWITYSWKDNDRSDVDYIAQQLQRAGLDVHLDKWDLRAGHRLWEQIDQAIANKDRCDAWMIVATQNSLASEPCKEEVAYALNQALSVRGSSFPVIALFQGAVEASLLPQALSTRLCVSCTDNDWIERIVATVEGRTATLSNKIIDPYDVQVHDLATSRFGGGPWNTRSRCGPERECGCRSSSGYPSPSEIASKWRSLEVRAETRPPTS